MDNRSLVLDLVEWIAAKPRTYSDVMTAWQTSCPRLSVWEDAVDAGFVIRHTGRDAVKMVSVTDLGLAAVAEERPDSIARSA